MTPRAGHAAVLAAIVATTAAVSSPGHANRLLLESYVGARPAEASHLMPLVRTIFDHHGFTTDPLVIAMVFREHSHRPGLSNPNFAELLKRGERRSEEAFWNENYLKAIDELAGLIVAMRQNPLIFTREPKYRELALRVLVFYALACGRQARAVADKPDEVARFERLRDDTLAEILRSYPSKVFSTKDFGDEGVKLLTQARDTANSRGRGRIAIATSDPDAQIYLDEIVQGTAKVEVGDLLPGVYRVLLVVPSGEARQYELDVSPNQTARLTVDWSVDSILVFDAHWAGFKYPSEKDHALEATLIHQLVQASSYAAIATTITVASARGRTSVTGTSYNTTTGAIFRTGRVELAGGLPGDTLLTRLADCLVAPATTPCGEGVLPVSHPEFTPLPAPIHDTATVALAQPPAAAQPSVAAAPPAHRAWPMWLIGVGAVGLVAVGVGAWYWSRGDHASRAAVGWSRAF